MFAPVPITKVKHIGLRYEAGGWTSSATTSVLGGAGKNGFLIVEGCNAAYFSTLTPVELIELGTELVHPAIRWEPS